MRKTHANTANAPTPTAIPTETSIPTDTPTPTPAPANVFGHLNLIFNSYGEGAVEPEKPLDITLVFTGEEKFRVALPPDGGDFSLNLPPGEYTLSSIAVSETSHSGTPWDLGAGNPAFTVPNEGCIHIGKLTLSYYRLPPISIPEQLGLIRKLASQSRKGFTIQVLKSGSIALDLDSITLEEIPESEKIPGVEACIFTPLVWPDF